MKKYRIVLGAVGLFVLNFGFSAFASEILWQDIGRGIADLRTAWVDVDNISVIYIGSSKGVFKTEDGGISWRNILSIRGQNRAVSFLLNDPAEKNSLYAATGNGLFYSSDQGANWRRIFQGKDYSQRDCTTLAILSDRIYLGTRAGLFVSRDKGRSWHKEKAQLGKGHILAIRFNPKEPGYIYVVSVDGVFKTADNGQSWERIFVAFDTENNGDENTEQDLEDQDEQSRVSGIKYISIDPDNPDQLYLASSRGIYQSKNKGQSWESLSNYGLLSQDIRFISISKDSGVYVATKSGIFRYSEKRWQELSLRLPAEAIYSLALDRQGNLYAASDKGLFKANIENPNIIEDKDILGLTSHHNEPTIEEIQQAAIRYAEVEADKIKEWRKKAKMKAILPKLTVGIDNSKSTNYEIYTSATTRYVYEGPDDNSSGWDITVSWDLSELIWNNDQTSIDVRSRLLVQLRDDILDEVTKLYFERLRVKMELENLSLEDRKKRFEKELRVEELTAMLNALTDGYFSGHIKANYQIKP